MKKLGLFFLAFFLFIPISKAASYYQTDDGNYMLCGGDSPSCFSVSPGQSGVTFNLSNEEIVYNGVSYYFDPIVQENYYQTLYGSTRMFFYQNSAGNYVLCETEDSCRTYTFERLTDMGATITNQSQIVMNNAEGPGLSGDIYYYNATKQAEVDAGINSGDNNGTSGSGNDVTVDSSEYCGKLKEPLMFIGNIVMIVKILIPIVIIAFGMIDFFKAITGSKDDEIKKSARSLVMRCIAGVIIFFIPTIVSLIFSLVDSFANIQGEFNACQKCVLNVRECK